MNPSDRNLDIQALVDGQLDAARQDTVARQVATDPDAALLLKSLRFTRQAVRSHEPAHPVPESREFYFGAICRRIAEEEPAATPAPPQPSVRAWFRWLAPALGVAAGVLAVARLDLRQTLLGGVFVEAESAEASSMVYRSERDGVTIHWIN